jgi:hypothetical protein
MTVRISLSTRGRRGREAAGEVVDEIDQFGEVRVEPAVASGRHREMEVPVATAKREAAMKAETSCSLGLVRGEVVLGTPKMVSVFATVAATRRLRIGRRRR